MSAYSDWKCGALSDDEYRMACAEEVRRDNAFFRNCKKCIHYVIRGEKKGCELWECKFVERPCDQCPHHIIVNEETGEGGCECWECEYEKGGDTE